MSALGQKQTSDRCPLMSALLPIADIAERDWDVRFVAKADMLTTSATLIAVAAGALSRRGQARNLCQLEP
jgi:hypothetical protein